MKLILLMLMVLSAFGQSIEVNTVPFVPPCEPGQWLFGITVCPPVEQQGIFVHVKASGEFSAYQVTVDYRTASGEARSAVETVPRRNDDGYHTAVFVIGRVKVGSMPGITIDGVAVKKLPSPTDAEFRWLENTPAVKVPVPGTLNGRIDHDVDWQQQITFDGIYDCVTLTSLPPQTFCGKVPKQK